MSAKRAFVDHVLEDNRERNLEYNYPTKDSVGIYCHVGLGMTRDITSKYSKSRVETWKDSAAMLAQC